MKTQSTTVTRLLHHLCLLLIAGLLTTACKKDKDKQDTPSGTRVQMKFTLKVTGADANDVLGFQVAAGNGDASQYGAPVWKVNGTTQGNESVLEFKTQDFIGGTKTIVVESVKGFDFGSLNVYCANGDANSLTVSYKAEIDGHVETNAENVAIVNGTTHIKDFTYRKR